MRRIPFTLALALTILVTTTVTGTLLRSINVTELVTWGFSAADLGAGRWSHLFLATFQILDPYLALSMLASVLALVGACEYRLGTVRTVLVYALSQALGFLAIVLVAKIFASTGSRWGAMLISEHNVGASAGAVGAMGAWLMAFPRPLRTWSIMLCAAFLLVAFGGDVHPWDVAHVTSFLVGLVMGGWFTRASRASRAKQSFSLHPGTQADRRAALAWAGVIVGLFSIITPFALVIGMAIPAMLARVTPHGFGMMRWVYFSTGVLLLAIAPIVRRGDARAYRPALAAGLISCVTLWQPGEPGVEHVLAILFVAGLVVWRSDLTSPARAPTRRSAVRGALALIAFALLFALFGFTALREHFVPPLGFEGSLHVARLRMQFIPPPSPNWNSPGARWFLDVLPVVAYGSGLFALFLLARARISGRKAAGIEGSTG